MASSGTINGSCTGSSASKYSFWIDWTESETSQENNTSKVTFYLRVKRNDGIAGSAWNLNKKPSVTLKIDGQTVLLDSLDYIDTRNSVTCTFGMYYTTRAHNADGSKSLSVSAAFTMYDTPTLTGGSLSGTAALNTIPRATTPVITAAVTMGSDAVISLPRASSSFTHTLTFAFGNAFGTIGTDLGTSAKWDVPLSLANQIPNTSSGIGTLTCKTYAGGALIGMKSVSFTASVPRNAETIPIINMTLSPGGSLPSAFSDMYIQGKTSVSADFTGSSAKYGASVLECSITVEGKTVSAAPYTSGMLSRSGDVAVTGTVRDSRGFTATVSKTVSVYAYSKPVLIPCSNEAGIICARCESDGTVSDAGTYLKIKVGQKFSKLIHEGVQKNFSLIRYRNKAASASTYSAWKTLLEKESESDEAEAILLGVVPSAAVTYVVEIGITDDMGEHAEIEYPIPTALASFHLKAGGNGAAFGKYAEKERTLELVEGWEFWYKGRELLDLIYPVGAIYQSANDVDPGLLFGGTWERIKGRFLLAADDETFPLGETGGSQSNTHHHWTAIGFDRFADRTAIYFTVDNSAENKVQSNVDRFTHNFSEVHTTGAARVNATADETISTMPPYIAVYVWKRTA